MVWEDNTPGNNEIFYSGQLSRVFLFQEDFEAITPPNLPAGWTVSSGWTSQNTPLAQMNGNYAIVSGNTAGNEDLITPTIDCSKAATVYLQLNWNFQATTTPGETQKVTIDISHDNGNTWNPVPPPNPNPPEGPAVFELRNELGDSSGTIRINISRYASGQSQVKIRFRYNNTGNDGYFAIDNIKIESVNAYTAP
ncbi:MAG: hypothetical protein D6785_11110 [Planctomycetota bacterium]|nr:MAG: hypothetical protein D6785_11110 [Planctomycetota bacterium]